jgi:hypothetical protein
MNKLFSPTLTKVGFLGNLPVKEKKKKVQIIKNNIKKMSKKSFPDQQNEGNGTNKCIHNTRIDLEKCLRQPL